MKYKVSVLLLLAVLLTGLLAIRYGRVEELTVGQWENTDGVAFPHEGKSVVVTEKLAHADVHLSGSPLARQLRLEIKWRPVHLNKLALGIRENSFWLSYPLVKICCASDVRHKTRVSTVVIPITDKIVAAKGYLDLMFFASYEGSLKTEDEKAKDRTWWVLENITVKSEPALPSWSEIKDYLKSRLTRERPL